MTPPPPRLDPGTLLGLGSPVCPPPLPHHVILQVLRVPPLNPLTAFPLHPPWTSLRLLVFHL